MSSGMRGFIMRMGHIFMSRKLPAFLFRRLVRRDSSSCVRGIWLAGNIWAGRWSLCPMNRLPNIGRRKSHSRTGSFGCIIRVLIHPGTARNSDCGLRWRIRPRGLFAIAVKFFSRMRVLPSMRVRFAIRRRASGISTLRRIIWRIARGQALQWLRWRMIW